MQCVGATVDSNIIPPCSPWMHEEIKSDAVTFVKLTTRLPHMPDEEAFDIDESGERVLHLRNCARCRTSLARRLNGRSAR